MRRPDISRFHEWAEQSALGRWQSGSALITETLELATTMLPHNLLLLVAQYLTSRAAVLPGMAALARNLVRHRKIDARRDPSDVRIEAFQLDEVVHSGFSVNSVMAEGRVCALPYHMVQIIRKMSLGLFLALGRIV